MVLKGIKLRCLQAGDRDATLWNEPPPGQIRVENLNWISSDSEKQRIPKRMIAIACNNSQIIGYSLLWSGRIERIFALRNGQDMSFDKDFTNSSLLHLPIDQGETVTEIYKGDGVYSYWNAPGVS